MSKLSLYAPSGEHIIMPKGSTTTLLDAGVKDKGTNSLSNSSTEHLSRPSRPSRMSVLATVKVPYLRRLDVGDGAHAHKTPLLTLKLSSHSFLDSSLKDDLSSSPLYTIRTTGMTTTVVRSDPWEESSRTATIKWPKTPPIKGKSKNVTDGVLVQLKGSRWKGGDALLKPSTSKDGPRKFSLPHYSHSMKWHKHGIAYWCTTSQVKGPIAILDPPVNSLPARLTVYETLHDKYDTRPMLVHQGVSILLLDYLLVTAVLLVTDIQEWMVVQSSPINSPASSSEPNSNGALQWRKIMYGEPLFPKLSPAATQYATPGGFDYPPPTPNSQDQIAKIMYGEPLYPRRQGLSKSQLNFSSDSEDDDSPSLSGASRTRSSSPTESILYSSTNVSTPSHTQLDQSFYFNRDAPAPPVPLLSTDYSSRVISTSPASTVVSPNTLLLPARLPSTHAARSRSSPPRPIDQAERSSQPQQQANLSGAIGPADASLWERRMTEPTITRARSMSRPLPRTPNAPGAGGRDPVIRRVQSHARINQTGSEKPWLSTPPPPLPPLPISPSTPRTGRSLPPTPLDIAMGRTTGAGGGRIDSRQLPQKSFEDEDNSNLRGERSGPSYDHPPPAYTSIDFHAATSQPWLTRFS